VRYSVQPERVNISGDQTHGYINPSKAPSLYRHLSILTENTRSVFCPLSNLPIECEFSYVSTDWIERRSISHKRHISMASLLCEASYVSLGDFCY
jgi:hypothetical protein